MNYDKKLFFDAWMSYMITSPVFTVLFGDPVRGIPGLLTQ